MSSKKRKISAGKNSIKIPYIPTEKKVKKEESESLEEEDYDMDDEENSSESNFIGSRKKHSKNPEHSIFFLFFSIFYKINLKHVMIIL